MKKLTMITLLSLLAFTAASETGVKTRKKSKKHRTEISCSKVDGAKRQGFFWKKRLSKLTDKRKAQICRSTPKKRKHKKAASKEKLILKDRNV